MDSLDANIEAAFTRLRAAMRDLEFTLERTKPEEPTTHWSPWMEWRGGPCPLPGDAIVSCRCEDGVSTRPGEEVSADQWDWSHAYGLGNILAFRYRADNPAGWLPRGEFIPPAELWAPECPVRCEWAIEGDLSVIGDAELDEMEFNAPDSFVTHIRLVARQPQAGLPEGFMIEDRALYSEFGVILGISDYEHYDPAAIRQAVDAWLREMGDE